MGEQPTDQQPQEADANENRNIRRTQQPPSTRQYGRQQRQGRDGAGGRGGAQYQSAGSGANVNGEQNAGIGGMEQRQRQQQQRNRQGGRQPTATGGGGRYGQATEGRGGGGREGGGGGDQRQQANQANWRGGGPRQWNNRQWQGQQQRRDRPTQEQRRPFIRMSPQQLIQEHSRFLRRNTKERIDHAGVPMAGEVSECLICCQRSDLFGIGECLHPVCMECALRIRVVGESRNCPQCRAEIHMMHFICAPPGQTLIVRLPSPTPPDAAEKVLEERQYGLRFQTQYARDCFQSYMANRCPQCAKNGNIAEFPSFAELRLHLTQMHQLTYCRICCDNLNVLTKDRRVYTMEELQQHNNGKLAGEEDGFRGHPTCQFCEERFYDDEQQYKHMRKDHYYCQFCDQDGLEQNVFYRNQQQLTQHNRRAHHPCLDPDCLRMGICFRTDMEVDVHRAKQHRVMQGGSRSGTIPLDIQFARSRTGGASMGQRRGGGGGDENVEQPTDSESSPALAPPPPPPPPQVIRIVPSAQSGMGGHQQRRFVPSVQSASHFPALPVAQPLPYGAPPGWSPPRQQQHQPPAQRHGRSTLAVHSNEQFPTLGGESGGGEPAAAGKDQQKGSTIWGKKTVRELFSAVNPDTSAANTAAKKEEESKRPKFVAAPECWPEHMQEKLKAREQGLPDPDPIQPPNWLDLLPSKKKEKKRKSKTVPVSAVAGRLAAAANSQMFSTSNSKKFNELAEFDETSEGTSASAIGQQQPKQKGGKKGQGTMGTEAGDEHDNLWSTAQENATQMMLTPSGADSDFMRIHLVSRETPREGGSANDQEMVIPAFTGPPPGFSPLLPYQPKPADKNLFELREECSDESTDEEKEEDNDNEENKQELAIAGQQNDESAQSQQPSSFVHLTMRSIASALFGDEGESTAAKGEDDNKNANEKKK